MTWDTAATAEQRAWEREQRRRYPQPKTSTRAAPKGCAWVVPAWTGPGSPQGPVLMPIRPSQGLLF